MKLQLLSLAERLDAAEGWRFWLDAPQVNRSVDGSAARLLMAGWMLGPAGAREEAVCVRAEGAVDFGRLACNMKRPDVIRRVLSAEPEGHPQLQCGFRGELPMPAEGFELGVQLAGVDVPLWLQRYRFAPASLLIEGRDGWLFLDNDTNGSVDQHTGRQLIDGAQLAAWSAYFSGVDRAAEAFGFRHVMAVVPSKEQVLADRYPHPRGAITPVDQLLELGQGVGAQLLFLAPALRLQVPREAQFMQTDTHWTDRGARVGALECMRALGLPLEPAARVLEADRFRVVDHEGDLGCKLIPPRKAPTEFLDAPHIWSLTSFDNHLPNFGHVAVFSTPEAPWQETLVVFGSSSSVQMLRFLHRLFRRLVFVHGAGGVVPEVLAHERPGYVLMQTNARFVVQAPSAEFDLRAMICQKLSEAGADLKARALKAANAVLPESPDALYAEMLREALA